MAKNKSDKLGDDSFNEYLERKKKLRKLHQRLKDTKENQEIYHKIMGSAQQGDQTEEIEEEL